MKRLLLYLCCLGLLASVTLADGPTLQMVKGGKPAVPTKIARLAPDGTVIESGEYYGTRGGEVVLVFDCFEPDVGDQCPPPNGDGSDAEPIGRDSCGSLPEGCDGGRWYFGTTYCNPYISNDMEFDPQCGGAYIYRMELGWYWHVNGAGTGENCRIIVETFEDFDDTCMTGDPNGQGAWLGGVRLDFGYMWGDPGHYWYTDVDLTDLDWVQLPLDGAGSYNIWLLTYEDADPNTSYLCTCGQTMLWGCGIDETPIVDCDGRGKGPCPTGESSDQGPIQWDDDYPTDGWHTAPDECYDLTGGPCPDPLGGMWCAYAVCKHDDTCPSDICGGPRCDQEDLGCLLAAWCSHEGDSNWDPDADLDGDGHVGHGDLGMLLGDWGC